MSSTNPPIGTPGTPWRADERKAWLALQVISRSYFDLVVTRIEALKQGFEVIQYGSLSYDKEYPLFAVKTKNWDDDKPTVLVTGGVHGYETSGVMGALSFLETRAKDYEDRVNILSAPCVSPWGFETINRWNALAVDPNRSFIPGSAQGSEEAAALMRFLRDLPDTASRSLLMHIDLHETTDTDNTVFVPARAARDGAPVGYKNEFENVPDGFYCVGNTTCPELPFQKAIIDGVQKVTHIAPPDAGGLIIGERVQASGVILYAARELGLCMGVTDAPYVTTTEVYPDSAGVTDDQCTAAQVVAVTSGLDYALCQQESETSR